GARPRKISARGAPPGGVSSSVPHPASPDMYGSVTPIAAAAAIAASTALPPCASMRTPASVAKGLAGVTMPRRPCAIGRRPDVVAYVSCGITLPPAVSSCSPSENQEGDGSSRHPHPLTTPCALTQHADVGGLRTLPASGLLVLYLVTLVECLVAVALNRAVVHEQILATLLRRNEPVPFLRAEPLHGTNCHTFHLFALQCYQPTLQPADAALVWHNLEEKSKAVSRRHNDRPPVTSITAPVT